MAKYMQDTESVFPYSGSETLRGTSPRFTLDGEEVKVHMRDVHVATLALNSHHHVVGVHTSPAQWQALLDSAGVDRTGICLSDIRVGGTTIAMLTYARGKVVEVDTTPRDWDWMGGAWRNRQ